VFKSVVSRDRVTFTQIENMTLSIKIRKNSSKALKNTPVFSRIISLLLYSKGDEEKLKTKTNQTH
jgi:hypothetical protein